MLNIVNVIKEKVKLRNQKRIEKEQQILEINNLLVEKQKLLALKVREYNLSLNDDILSEIDSLKSEITRLKDQKDTIQSNGILNENFRYPYDKGMVIQELDEKLKDLNFDKLKENIVKTQTNYIDSLREYEKAVKSLLAERVAIKSEEKNIDIETLKVIQQWFNRNYRDIYINSELKVGNTNSNVYNLEARLFDSIQDRTSSLDGGISYSFESLKNNN